ncbi:MAG: hypothetical protein GXN93_00650 [Candidatus Diapherotrites archaeon]|nr:hypothetical protein [Candidatus Diapherotrites archaeon]
MLLLHRDRLAGETKVHYLPDGRVLELADGTVVGRNGNYVIIQRGRDKFTINGEGSINMTTSEITVMPIERILERAKDPNALDILHKLEELAFEEKMPNDVRRFIRLYAALLGLEMIDNVPKSYLESVVLTVSRLSGEEVGKIIAARDEIREKLREELNWAMNALDPKTLASAVNTVIAV